MSIVTGAAHIYRVNAFTASVAGGNPAAVCLLDEWPSDDRLRSIAMASGPSVTAFVLPAVDGIFPLRWFTRGGREVRSVCGHATFAAAHVLTSEEAALATFSFEAVSGRFAFRRGGALLEMHAPAWAVAEHAVPAELQAALKTGPRKCFKGDRDWLLLYDGVDELAALAPDFDRMRALGDVGIIATAPAGADKIAFRFFCPGFSIGENEDPGTGSALSSLIPFWAARLGRRTLSFDQLSGRGASFVGRARGPAVVIGARCVTTTITACRGASADMVARPAFRREGTDS